MTCTLKYATRARKITKKKNKLCIFNTAYYQLKVLLFTQGNVTFKLNGFLI